MSTAPSRPPSPPQSERPGPDGSSDSAQQDPAAGGPSRSSRRLARNPLGLALLALGAAGVSMFMTSGPLWMTVAGVVSGVAALVFSVMAILGLRRANRRTLILISTLVAMVVAGFSLITGGVRLAFWDTVSGYEQCVAQSVTISGQAACQEKMEDDLRGLLLPGLG
ncbi:hypothetical protein [Kocuria sp.]|uniref:hypothetical protein n=1 Tax=Kocuria sp. TaxID=1871328 RepID=UPI0026DFA285|nr:hypothetical protein [Kocuria sp.]MDO5617579.1 hypothetical protein [Kocuria sp.]